MLRQPACVSRISRVIADTRHRAPALVYAPHKKKLPHYRQPSIRARQGFVLFPKQTGRCAPSFASCLAPPVAASGGDHEILPATTRFYRSRRLHVIFSARFACPRPGNGSKSAEKERKAECVCCSRHLSRSTKGAGLGAEFGRRRSGAASVSACACLAPRRGRSVTLHAAGAVNAGAAQTWEEGKRALVIRSTRPRDLGGPRWTSAKNPAGLGSVGAFGRHCKTARREKTPSLTAHCAQTHVCSWIYCIQLEALQLIGRRCMCCFFELEACALSK